MIKPLILLFPAKWHVLLFPDLGTTISIGWLRPKEDRAFKPGFPASPDHPLPWCSSQPTLIHPRARASRRKGSFPFLRFLLCRGVLVKSIADKLIQIAIRVHNGFPRQNELGLAAAFGDQPKTIVVIIGDLAANC
jgi:hypothetical protein